MLDNESDVEAKISNRESDRGKNDVQPFPDEKPPKPPRPSKISIAEVAKLDIVTGQQLPVSVGHPSRRDE
jgi:hypothetical protein